MAKKKEQVEQMESPVDLKRSTLGIAKNGNEFSVVEIMFDLQTGSVGELKVIATFPFQGEAELEFRKHALEKVFSHE